MGNVLPAGVGHKSRRPGAIFAGLSPAQVPLEINRFVARDFEAVALSRASVQTANLPSWSRAGWKMTNAPYLLAASPQKESPRQRQGDWTPWVKRRPLGYLQRLSHGRHRRKRRREICITREEQDEFAVNSHRTGHRRMEECPFSNRRSSRRNPRQGKR